MPPGVARPKAWVSRSTSPQRVPAARAVRVTGSTQRPFIGDRSITTPPSHVAVPATLWPPPRTATTSCRSRANRTAARTSATPVQRATSTGRRSIAPVPDSAGGLVRRIACAGSALRGTVARGRRGRRRPAPGRCDGRYRDVGRVAMVHLLLRQDGPGRPPPEIPENGVAAAGAAPLRSAPMKGYGQFCPVTKAAEIVAERWTPLVLRELLCGSRRFSDLHRGVPLDVATASRPAPGTARRRRDRPERAAATRPRAPSMSSPRPGRSCGH